MATQRARYDNNVLTPAGIGSPIVHITPYAEISVFEAGTTTSTPGSGDALVQTLYANPTGGTTLPNPIVADEYGNFEFYLDVKQDVDMWITGFNIGDVRIRNARVLPSASEMLLSRVDTPMKQSAGGAGQDFGANDWGISDGNSTVGVASSRYPLVNIQEHIRPNTSSGLTNPNLNKINGALHINSERWGSVIVPLTTIDASGSTDTVIRATGAFTGLDLVGYQVDLVDGPAGYPTVYATRIITNNDDDSITVDWPLDVVPDDLTDLIINDGGSYGTQAVWIQALDRSSAEALSFGDHVHQGLVVYAQQSGESNASLFGAVILAINGGTEKGNALALELDGGNTSTKPSQRFGVNILQQNGTLNLAFFNNGLIHEGPSTSTATTSTSISRSGAGWSNDQWAGKWVIPWGGSQGFPTVWQPRVVSTNTSDTLTVPAWDSTPAPGTLFYIADELSSLFNSYYIAMQARGHVSAGRNGIIVGANGIRDAVIDTYDLTLGSTTPSLWRWGNGQGFTVDYNGTDYEWLQVLSGIPHIRGQGIVSFEQLGTGAIFAQITVGGIDIPGTGKRISGDTVNGSLVNRLAFQDRATDANTNFGVIPNGTSRIAGVNAYNTSTFAHTDQARARMMVTSTESRIEHTTLAGTAIPFWIMYNNVPLVLMDGNGLAFHGNAPIARETVTGSRASGAALQDLLTKLDNKGIINDGTSA